MIVGTCARAYNTNIRCRCTQCGCSVSKGHQNFTCSVLFPLFSPPSFVNAPLPHPLVVQVRALSSTWGLKAVPGTRSTLAAAAVSARKAKGKVKAGGGWKVVVNERVGSETLIL